MEEQTARELFTHLYMLRRHTVLDTAGVDLPQRDKDRLIFTPQPSGLEGYCRHGPGGRLPNLRNPYLCNRLTDFLHSKFCGIV